MSARSSAWSTRNSLWRSQKSWLFPKWSLARRFADEALLVRGEALRVCVRLVVVRADLVVEVPEALAHVRVVADEALLVPGEALCARLLLVTVLADLAVGVPEALVRLLGDTDLPLCALGCRCRSPPWF